MTCLALILSAAKVSNAAILDLIDEPTDTPTSTNPRFMSGSSNIRHLLRLCRLYCRGGYGVHDVVDGTAARKVVAGTGKSLKNGEARRAAQTLGDLVADVARLQIWEDEHVRAPGYRASLRLERCHLWNEGGIQL